MEEQGKFKLMNVDEFGQWLNSNSFSRVIKLIQNHHTYAPAYSDFDGQNHFKKLTAMESFHIAKNHFSQIAQNLTTFPDGKIAVCRPLDIAPAGILGANQYGICIENLGYFDIGKDIMTDAHKTCIIKTNAMLCRKFNLTPSTDSIVYHHWYDMGTGKRTNGTGSTKSCPGTNFFGGNSVEAAQANFIPLINEALSQLTGGATPTVVGHYRVINSDLNVRKGPGIANSVINILPMGTVVNVYEEKTGWCRINPTEQQWVSKNYLLQVEVNKG
jgi:hypothetical protein